MRWLGVVTAGQEIQTWVGLAATAARYAVALAANVVVAATLYLPRTEPPAALALCVARRDGGHVALVGLHVGFAWYVRNIADYNVLYGSIGAAIALLVWMYVLAAVALIGCEFNAEYERLVRLAHRKSLY